MSNKKKQKGTWRNYIGVWFFLLMGVCCGLLMGKYMVYALHSGKDRGKYLFILAGLFVGMYLMMYLHIIIHEGGHLIFGLLTGYRYSSFRIGKLMWIKEDGKIRFRKFSIAGTGGQCLMIPPEMEDGKIPFVLYNMGGALANIIAMLLFVLLYRLYGNSPFFSTLFLMAAIIGFIIALMNGVPMRLGTVNNDGYNALSLGKDKTALRAFWIQLKANEQVTRGVRLKDMPEEWFAVPSPEEMKNSMIAVMGALACSRLMDECAFTEAHQLMDQLLKMDTAIVGLHRNLLTCDLIYCELIDENRREKLDELLDKQQRSFMKSMKSFLTVARTEYVYALMAEKDTAKAAKMKERFEKTACIYPFSGDVESERELIGIADQKQIGRENEISHQPSGNIPD